MTARRQRWIVLLATLAGVALGVRLGVWQLDRAEQKNRLQATLSDRLALPPLPPQELAHEAAGAAAQHHRAFAAEGQWLPAFTVYLENRQLDGRPGFLALTPLRLDDGSALLVQRGWVARDNDDRTRIVLPPLPAGRVAVQGRIAPAPARLYEFDAAASGPIRQNLDLGAYARETALPLRPLTLVQEDGAAAPADGLLRRWPRPDAGVQKHYGYAFQWFSLATLVLGLYVWFQFIRPRRAGTRG